MEVYCARADENRMEMQVAKQAQAYFLKVGDATARERELVRVVTDNELVAQMISNARIVAAPGSGAKGGGGGGKGGR